MCIRDRANTMPLHCGKKEEKITDSLEVLMVRNWQTDELIETLGEVRWRRLNLSQGYNNTRRNFKNVRYVSKSNAD